MLPHMTGAMQRHPDAVRRRKIRPADQEPLPELQRGRRSPTGCATVGTARPAASSSLDG